MEINEIFELHRRSKTKVNLIYQRPSGRFGHCYIDPSKPLRRSMKGNNYGYPVHDLDELIRCGQDLTIGVYKQQGDIEIFVKPEHLWIHSGKVEQVVKVLYGKPS